MGRAPNPGTIRDGERAAELAKRKAERDRERRMRLQAAKDAAAVAAQTTAGGAATPPQAAPFGTPASVAQSAQSGATSAAARILPPACRVELERLAPAWPGCRGYLETIDSDTLRSYGLREYLRETWGGERFKVTVIDPATDSVLWMAADVFVAGRPRHYGAPVEPPRSIPAPSYAPPPAPAGPVAAVAAPPSPAASPSGLSPAERVELVQLVRRLADQLDAAQQEIGRLRTAGPSAAPPAADIGAVFHQARATLAAAREFADEVDVSSGGRAPAAPPADEDRHSPISREIMRGLAQRIGASLVADIGRTQPPSNGNGNGGGYHPPPSSAGAPAVEAEIVE